MKIWADKEKTLLYKMAASERIRMGHPRKYWKYFRGLYHRLISLQESKALHLWKDLNVLCKFVSKRLFLTPTDLLLFSIY